MTAGGGPTAVGGGSCDVDELTALLALTERLLTAGDAESVATALLETVVTIYGFPRAVVLTGGALQHSRIAARHGLAADAPRWAGRSPGVNRAHESGVPQVVPPGSTDPLAAQLPSDSCEVLVVGMQAEAQPVGALVVQVPKLL